MTTTPISLQPDAPAKGLRTAPDAVKTITIAHSPDSDDAFMFYGLATCKIRVPGYKFTHTLCDIETLNHKAMDQAFYDVTAISFHAYPYIQEDYALMACGGSVGENYGPMIVARERIAANQIGRVRIAVPGTLTTAYLALKLFAPEVETVTVPFDKIIPEVVAGNFTAGLIIHEGQLTYTSSGLYKVIDLGAVVAGTDRIAFAAGRERDSPQPGPGCHADGDAGASREHPARARPSRRGARLLHAICPRPRPSVGQPLCEHVR